MSNRVICPPAPIIILFGGPGNEYRVSVASAQNIANHLPDASLWFWSATNTVTPIDRTEILDFKKPFENDFRPRLQEQWSDIGEALSTDLAKKSILLLALHGDRSENGSLQKQLEALKIPFTGSDSKASRHAFDKVRARDTLSSAGIRVASACELTPDTLSLSEIKNFFAQHNKIVAKPISDGSSHGLHIITSKSELDTAIEAIKTAEVPYLAEAFVRGQELTVGVINDKGTNQPLPCSAVKLDPDRHFDYEGKYLGKGVKEITPAPVRQNVSDLAQEIALMAHNLLDCFGYSRTDLIIDKDGAVFLETNTLPGLTKASFIPQQLSVAGIPLDKFLVTQVEMAHERTKRLLEKA